jgi:hypothetical protein
MRTKLKDFKMPETWCIKIQPNNYKVLNNWRRSKGMPKLPIERVSGKFLNHWGYLLDWAPLPAITFPQFRKYVYPDKFKLVEKAVKNLTDSFKPLTVAPNKKENVEKYGFIVGTKLNSAIHTDLGQVQEFLIKQLSESPFEKGYIFKVVKTIKKEITYTVQ